MAVINADTWIPEEDGSEVLQKVVQESAVEAHGRKIPMASNTRTVPRSGGTAVEVVSKSGTYTEQADTLDEVTLTARKFGGLFRIAEEDINDSLADVLQTLRTDWAQSYARHFDNACLGVTAAENGTTVPFTSVYKDVSDNASGNIVTSPTGAAVTYDELSNVLGIYEQSDYFSESDALVIAHPAFREVLREIKDSQNRPIFVQGQLDNPDRLFGYQLKWSQGAAKNATASDSPSGDKLLIVCNRQFLLNGVRSGPESLVSTDASFTTDEPLLKVRARRGFAVGRPQAFAVLEDLA